MLEYFHIYYIERLFGPSYGVTNLLILGGMLLILRSYGNKWQSIGRFLADLFVLWTCSLIFQSVYYKLFGGANLDTARNLVFSILLILIIKDYDIKLRILRILVYFSCFDQILVISEPIGEWLKDFFGTDKTWLESSTWLVVMMLILLSVYLINRWELSGTADIPIQPVILIILFSLIGMVLQITARTLEIPRTYRVIVGMLFYAAQLLSYYLFYLLRKEIHKNVEMLTLAHKERLDQELLAATRDNMENLQMIRHEIKNHMTYIRVLVANEKYEKLFDYTNKVLGENEQYIRSIASGNQVVDAVISHAVSQAERMGITLTYQVVVPEKLPYAETDFCSILSNLLNNALEAAANCEESEKQIDLQILPKQDYLFIHMTNPVGKTYSQHRILSLKTTKEDARLHGYGTKIIAKLVEKYDGSVNYQIKDNRFVSDVMLDLYMEGREETAL